MSEQSYVCPVCGRESFNENDVRERWCGNCAGLTSEMPPDGFEWVTFVEHDGSVLFGRLVEIEHVSKGDTYHRLVEGASDGVYDFDGQRYVRR